MSVQFGNAQLAQYNAQIMWQNTVSQYLAKLLAREPKEKPQRSFKNVHLDRVEDRRYSTIDARRELRSAKIFERRFTTSVEAKALHIGEVWKNFAATKVAHNHEVLAVFKGAVDLVIEDAVQNKWTQVLEDDDHSFEWTTNQRMDFVNQIANLYRELIVPVKQQE